MLYQTRNIFKSDLKRTHAIYLVYSESVLRKNWRLGLLKEYNIRTGAFRTELFWLLRRQ
jgi:hypothetical protein